MVVLRGFYGEGILDVWCGFLTIIGGIDHLHFIATFGPPPPHCHIHCFPGVQSPINLTQAGGAISSSQFTRGGVLEFGYSWYELTGLCVHVWNPYDQG